MHNRVLFPVAVLLALACALPSSYAALQAAAGIAEVSVVSHGLSGLEMTTDLSNLPLNAILGEGSVELSGEGEIGLPGWPALPSISRLIVVPPTAGIKLNVTSSDPRVMANVHLANFPTEDHQGHQDFADAVEYGSVTGFWPPVVAHVDAPVIMRGVRMVRVTVTPVQYNRQTGELRVYDHVETSLDFTVDAPVNPVLNPARLRPSASANRILRSLVANPDALRRDDPVERGAIVYVIPDFQGVAEAIQPLVDWRRRQGFPTEVITVAQHASNVDVKVAIQNAYENWEVPPEIVCLVGEADLQSADFMIPTWDVGRAYQWETDYKYALLEGADLLPEIAIGRISVRSLNELRFVVGKIVGYETDPFMDDTTWFQSAALMANDPRTGYSSVYLQRWARKLLTEVGFAAVDTFYFIHDNAVTDHNFIRDHINAGISLFNYRGWGQFNGAWVVGQSGELHNGRMLPFLVLPTCNTGDFADHVLADHAYSEDFLWATGGGAIGTIGSSGFTHTNYNNVFDGGVLNGLYRDSLYQTGWALNQGKIELYRHFGLFNDAQDPQVQNLLVWEAHAYQFNLIGDPATEVWTGVPQRLAVEHPDTLNLGEQRMQVLVTDAGGDAPMSGTRVSLIQNNQILRTETTPANGELTFSFAPGELAEGTLLLSASGHDLFPLLDTLVVRTSDQFVAASSVLVDDDNAGRSHGNGDHIPNPGETVELRTYISNFGASAPQGALDLTLTAAEGELNVTSGHVHLDNTPALGDSTVVTFIVVIGANNWDGRRLLFDLEAVGGDQTWHSSFALTAGAPNLEYVRHQFTPDPFAPGDTAWVDITLHNLGRMVSPVMHARLVSLTQGVNVFNERADYPSISILGNDSLGTARFRIHAHSLTVPGTKASLMLLLNTDAGMLDTARFTYTIGSPEENTPFGPDAYGYVCFDNTDTRWDTAPQYDWVELDTALGGLGVNTEIHDRGNEQDWSILTDLPFDTRYYGQSFDHVTICSNGWFSFGDESKLADFQNRRIPPALGPRAQVCVFWDDLINYVDSTGAQIGGIYTLNDSANHRYIIEWSRMRRYVGMQNDTIRPGNENTFEAIIYDPQFYPTYTGDGDIVLQYHTVHNDFETDPNEFDTPYATVGIVNLNGTDGMEYTYWNQYATGAAPLQDGRAIKFSTKLIVVVGCVEGSVIDAATRQPIRSAEIRGSRGSFGLTDNNGRFLMDNVLVGDDYSFTAWAAGYNDSTVTGKQIAEGDTISLAFALRHPTFRLSADSVDFEVRPEFATHLDLTLTNDGNGPLTFSSRFDYGDNAGGGLWNRLLDINVTQATGENRVQGVDFFGGKVWVTGSNNNNNPNRFYRFNTDGSYAGYLTQPGNSSFGFRGTTTDDSLLWGGEGSFLIGVNTRGEAVDSIPAPLSIQRDVAWDSRADRFWVANGRQEPLVQIDRLGNVQASFQFELDISGLGYFPDDPEGYTVYILSRDRTDPTRQIPQALVSKFNPETGDMKPVIALQGSVEDLGGGMEITSRFDPRKWVLMAILNNPAGHHFSVYDLGPNTRWISYSPRSGSLDAGQNLILHVAVSAEGLTTGDYNLLLRYDHNAAGLHTDIPIHLNVNDAAGLETPISVPLTFKLGEVYPNPFNSTAVIPFSLPEAGRIKLAIYDLSGREVTVLAEGKFSAGRYSRTLNATALPSGVYIARLSALGKSSAVKIALVR